MSIFYHKKTKSKKNLCSKDVVQTIFFAFLSALSSRRTAHLTNEKTRNIDFLKNLFKIILTNLFN